jgi:hypothetical protein
MTRYRGQVRKMKGVLQERVKYFMRLTDNDDIELSKFIDHDVKIRFMGSIFCVQCGRKTNKSFQQGHCFPCMRKINECGNCQLFPERCQVEKGGCVTGDWAHRQCNIPHVVYLSNTSNLKVGVTSENNPVVRWIDQGAMQAIELFKTENRYQAGLIEVVIKKHIADKTNWRTMLKQDSTMCNIQQEAVDLLSQCEMDLTPVLQQYPTQITLCDGGDVTEISYPVLDYPDAVRSLSLDKTSEISGCLKGIKGQYWILDTGVLNIRKFSGYDIEFEVKI